MLKSITLIIFGLMCCLSQLASADDVVSESEHKCHIQGCLVKCAYEEGEWRTVGTARNVTITIYGSGITKLILNQGLNKVQTVIMGGNGYICTIENEQD